MDPISSIQAVQHFYDFHPISAEQIFSAVAARHIAHEDITQAVLSAHDQDHYGGTEAVDRLMAQAAITAQDHVLDVCAGMGGPARYIAWKTGCQVTGLDLTASRVIGAQALTAAAHLTEQVRFVHGNALEMPFDPAQFTCIISQEAFAHIPNKRQLIGQCERALAPGGRMVFSDIMSHQALGRPDAQKLFDGMRFSEIATLGDYQQWFADAGMQWVQSIDLSRNGRAFWWIAMPCTGLWNPKPWRAWGEIILTATTKPTTILSACTEVACCLVPWCWPAKAERPRHTCAPATMCM